MSADTGCEDTGDTGACAWTGAPESPGGLWFVCGLRPEPLGGLVVLLAALFAWGRR